MERVCQSVPEPIIELVDSQTDATLSPNRVLYYRIGSSLELRCRVERYWIKPVRFQWLRSGKPVSDDLWRGGIRSARINWKQLHTLPIGILRPLIDAVIYLPQTVSTRKRRNRVLWRASWVSPMRLWTTVGTTVAAWTRFPPLQSFTFSKVTDGELRTQQSWKIGVIRYT